MLTLQLRLATQRPQPARAALSLLCRHVLSHQQPVRASTEQHAMSVRTDHHSHLILVLSVTPHPAGASPPAISSRLCVSIAITLLVLCSPGTLLAGRPARPCCAAGPCCTAAPALGRVAGPAPWPALATGTAWRCVCCCLHVQQ